MSVQVYLPQVFEQTQGHNDNTKRSKFKALRSVFANNDMRVNMQFVNELIKEGRDSSIFSGQFSLKKRGQPF